MKKDTLKILLSIFLVGGVLGVFTINRSFFTKNTSNQQDITKETWPKKIDELSIPELGITLNLNNEWFAHKPMNNEEEIYSIAISNHNVINLPLGLDDETGIGIFISNRNEYSCYSSKEYPQLISLGIGEKYENDCRIFIKTDEKTISSHKTHVFDEINTSKIESNGKSKLYLLETNKETINITILSKNKNLTFEDADSLIESIIFN